MAASASSFLLATFFLFLLLPSLVARPLQSPTSLPFLHFPSFDPPPHFPILDNLFLLLNSVSCFNCTYFVSIDTPLRFTSPLSQRNIHLLHYQVVPFNLPLKCLTPLPLAFRIPSFLPGSYVLVTTAQDNKAHSPMLSLNYQLLMAADLYVSDYMVVHGITGFLAPFALSVPFPKG